MKERIARERECEKVCKKVCVCVCVCERERESKVRTPEMEANIVDHLSQESCFLFQFYERRET